MAKNLSDCKNPEHNFVIEKSILLPYVITSVNISRNGEIAASTSNANITLLDAISNDVIQVLPCEMGATNLQFNHTNNSLLFSCIISNNVVKSLDYTTGKYLNKYIDGKAEVHSISMHPEKNMFVTSNGDKTLKLWDERSGKKIDSSTISAPGIATYHPDGIAVFAANHNGMFVYDTRRFSSGSLMAYLPARAFDQLRCVRISPNGKLVAVLDGDVVEILLTKEITPVNKYTGFSTDKNIPVDMCFSVDSSTFITSTTDGDLAIWNTNQSKGMYTIRSDDLQAIQSMKMNPEYMQLCTAAGRNLSFWQLGQNYVKLFNETYKSLIGSNISQSSFELEFKVDPTPSNGLIKIESVEDVLHSYEGAEPSIIIGAEPNNNNIS
ncbi:WD repeat-containing protein 82-like [Teleopsis dalmanni]|uniref:WD repeat-containing protein 82-like n=1 Tax=Teleopsis dalmanni TaxID=139649 RepID=UPI0018CDB305|nr:WD repeat-containing protein 82-like [Teleopsis dalmanni]